MMPHVHENTADRSISVHIQCEMHLDRQWKAHLVKESENDNVQRLAVQQPNEAFVTGVQRCSLLVRWPGVASVNAGLFQAECNQH